MNVVEAMKAYPSMKIAIVTYQDSSEISGKLLEKRFMSIRDMLMSNGIEKERLENRTMDKQQINSKSKLVILSTKSVGAFYFASHILWLFIHLILNLFLL